MLVRMGMLMVTVPSAWTRRLRFFTCLRVTVAWMLRSPLVVVMTAVRTAFPEALEHMDLSFLPGVFLRAGFCFAGVLLTQMGPGSRL